MASRYYKTGIIVNDFDEYKEILERRGITKARQYRNNILKYPTPKDISEMDIVTSVWKLGDSMMKYAHMYYEGRANLWWIIAHFNGKPTDHHFKIGDIIYIPLPLDIVLRSYDL